ncbi:CinA family protein [Sideroxydans lithotrophicus]|uniref:CinA domain protein n=1 Tax=Sideroxydans lithotrophicus (strain ES-1) TaxID=580332 RepID=D5CU22_SIDLE|nr:nicotinamide-nucleotide amidohydrolase family protein [Sideroxydans lithotrophicus]ADE12334.1 CinA domain protein [Sideroxydans lithotrophicus ES-1]
MSARLAKQLGSVLKAHAMMLATAESCTGGGVAQAVTRISGSSAWFDRGFVTYSNTAKEEMLGVAPETLVKHGAVSEATVREMAQGALQYSRAQVALSVSGIAGPTGGTPEKPVGTVWFAWATSDTVRTACHHLAGDRDAIRVKAVRIALQGTINLLNNITKLA